MPSIGTLWRNAEVHSNVGLLLKQGKRSGESCRDCRPGRQDTVAGAEQGSLVNRSHCKKDRSWEDRGYGGRSVNLREVSHCGWQELDRGSEGIPNKGAENRNLGRALWGHELQGTGV